MLACIDNEISPMSILAVQRSLGLNLASWLGVEIGKQCEVIHSSNDNPA